MTGKQFADAMALELALTPLQEDEVEAILKLASVAAHSSERLAAPLACYLAGLSDASVSEAIEMAQRVAPE